MSADDLEPIGLDERSNAYATLVLAFVTDPAIRWLYPDAQQYVTHFPRFLAAFGGRAFDEKTAWRFRDFSSVALWLPPGAEPDSDAIVAVLSESVAPEKHENCSRSSSRWTPHIPRIRIGICRGSALTQCCRVKESEASCWRVALRASTKITCPPTSNPRIPATSLSMNVTASMSWEPRRQVPRQSSR